MSRDLASVLLRPDRTIRQAMRQMNENERGIVLVVDEKGVLLDTVTDGDLRRAMLDGVDLDTSLAALSERRAGSPYPEPVTVAEEMPHAEVMALMSREKLRHIPVVDAKGRVTDLVVAGDTVSGEPPNLEVSALVMAGGLGIRLRPLTDTVPKPLLPVGDKPIMEYTIQQLSAAGVRRVLVSTHYKAEAFHSHFGDGARFGIEMEYVQEEQPLGTAGALRLMEQPSEPILVINGDVLTQVNYHAMLSFHQEYAAQMTVGVTQYEFEVPYGVVEIDGVEIRALVEKPHMRHFVNAGLYLLEPSVLEHIPEGQRFDMTDLIQAVIGAGQRVVSFPISEYWRDLGQHGDYVQAEKDVSDEGLFPS